MEFADIYRNLTNDLVSPPGKNYKILNYGYLEYSADYEGFFQAVMLNKKDMFKGLIPEPFYFYYMDTPVNDAYASRQLNGCSVIGISQGLFENLIKSCLGHKSILEGIAFSENINMSIFVGARIDQFMYIIARYFLQFHEMGHIIQFTGLNQSAYMHESHLHSSEGLDILLEHVKERDVDMCGANFATSHIVDRWKRIPHALRTQESFETLVSFGLVGIYVLFDLLSDGIKQNIYYLRTGHPHTVIRLHWIIGVIVNKAEKDSGIKLDLMKILIKTREVLHRLDMDISAHKFISMMARHNPQVSVYEKILVNEVKSYPWLFINQFQKRRNFRVKKAGKR